jgi:hypothetical protein
MVDSGFIFFEHFKSSLFTGYIPKNVIEVISDREYQEILRREKVYRDGNSAYYPSR